MLIVDSTAIERVNGQRWRLRWQARPQTHPVHVSLEHTPDEVLAVGSDGELELELSAGGRPVFLLHDGTGRRSRVAERRIPLQGTPNFRDFGGYHTADGRQVRWGRLYRSGHLAELTEADVELLTELQLTLVCDFRHDAERQRDPSRLPTFSRVVDLPITPGSASSFYSELESGTISSQQTGDFMEAINREFALEQREPYRRMFEQVLDADVPLLVHCAAGKDRTGFAAALILAGLGVPRREIVADYLLTGEYLRPEREVERLMRKHGMNGDGNRLLPMLEVRESYIAAALSAIDAEFGTIETYLQSHLGIGPDELRALRERLLYPSE